jgi:hypothetical protein
MPLEGGVHAAPGLQRTLVRGPELDGGEAEALGQGAPFVGVEGRKARERPGSHDGHDGDDARGVVS